MRCCKAMLCVLAALGISEAVLTGIVTADPIPITNASFETPVLDDGKDSDSVGGFGTVTAWTAICNNGAWAGVWNSTATYFAEDSDGNLVGGEGKNLLDLYVGGGQDVLVYNQLNDTTLKAGKYTLTVAIGSPTGYSCSDNWAIRLGSISGNSVTVLGEITQQTGGSVTVGSLSDKSFSLDISQDNTHLGESLVVGLYASNNVGSDVRVSCFDNVHLDYVGIPEPCSMAIMATGLFSMLAYAWRKRK